MTVYISGLMERLDVMLTSTPQARNLKFPEGEPRISFEFKFTSPFNFTNDVATHIPYRPSALKHFGSPPYSTFLKLCRMETVYLLGIG